jgi:hypothetical protein
MGCLYKRTHRKECIKIIRRNRRYTPVKVIRKNARRLTVKFQKIEQTDFVIPLMIGQRHYQFNINKYYQIVKFTQSFLVQKNRLI